jgi:tRNA threonylcarbamoyladenosine biosynthesis protein TsaB
MRVLGIDTASPTASAAIVEDGALIAEEIRDRAGAARNGVSPTLKGNHSEIVLPLIDAVLAKSGLRLDDLSGIAISIGPGSFTGLRIGLATVKGLAYDRQLPVVGVSTLWANAARMKGWSGLICSLLDARKREVYAGLFQSNGQRLTRLTEDAIDSLRHIVDLVKSLREANDQSLIFIGDGATVYEKLLLDEFAPFGQIASETSSVAAAVAALGLDRFSSGASDDLGALAPLYLRPSEAESKLGKSRLTC